MLKAGVGVFAFVLASCAFPTALGQTWCTEPTTFDPNLPAGKSRHYAYFTTMNYDAGQQSQYQLGCRKKGNQTYLASFIDEEEWDRGLLASKATCVSGATLGGNQKEQPGLWKWEYSAPDRSGQIFYNASNDQCKLTSKYCPWGSGVNTSDVKKRPDLQLLHGQEWGTWKANGHLQPYGCEVWNSSSRVGESMSPSSDRTYRLLNHSATITSASQASSLCQAKGGYLGSMGTLADYWQYFNDTEPFYDAGPRNSANLPGKTYQGLTAWMDGSDQESPGSWKWKYAAPDRAGKVFSLSPNSNSADTMCLVEFCNWFWGAPETSGQLFMYRVSSPRTDTVWRISEVVSKKEGSASTSFYICEFPKGGVTFAPPDTTAPHVVSTTTMVSSTTMMITTTTSSLDTTTTATSATTTTTTSAGTSTTSYFTTDTAHPSGITTTQLPHSTTTTPSPTLPSSTEAPTTTTISPVSTASSVTPSLPTDARQQSWLIPVLVVTATVLFVIVLALGILFYICRRNQRLQDNRELEQAFLASLHNEDPSRYFPEGSARELQTEGTAEGWRKSPLRVERSPSKGSPVVSIRKIEHKEEHGTLDTTSTTSTAPTGEISLPQDENYSNTQTAESETAVQDLLSPLSAQQTGDLMLRHHLKEAGIGGGETFSSNRDASGSLTSTSHSIAGPSGSNTQISDTTTTCSQVSAPSTTAAAPTVDGNHENRPTTKITLASFKKGKILGSGSFGKVYLGLDPRTGGLVAAKEVTFSDVSDNSKMEREMKLLRTEITLMKKLDHPNIVRYLGADRGDDGCSIYIFLEYMPGGSLQSIVQNFGPAEPQVAARYVKQAVQGLRYLHSQRVVHRDVKAANMLVDKDGSVKLADFGCSQSVESISSIKGTPLWLAPEVIRQTKAEADDNSSGQGPPSDIWSIGCVAMELLSGKNPFEWLGSPFNVMRTVASGGQALDDALDVKILPAKITCHPDAHDFILQCCKFEPQDRPSASELLYHPWLAQDNKSQTSSLNDHTLHEEEHK